jgi:catechol 2,3-dioxygenase-like lactoylglutathione lyase family enzyme
MTKTEISGIAPFFIVKNVPVALAFYRDYLGFDITFQGPSEDDIFFGIVQRGAAMIILKDIGVDPVPNYTRDIKKGIARWDAYLHVPDPDALAAEFSSRNVEFFTPLKVNDDGLRGFEVKDADGYLLYFGRPRRIILPSLFFDNFSPRRILPWRVSSEQQWRCASGKLRGTRRL